MREDRIRVHIGTVFSFLDVYPAVFERDFFDRSEFLAA
jgi:hypothetical protein